MEDFLTRGGSATCKNTHFQNEEENILKKTSLKIAGIAALFAAAFAFMSCGESTKGTDPVEPSTPVTPGDTEDSGDDDGSGDETVTLTMPSDAATAVVSTVDAWADVNDYFKVYTGSWGGSTGNYVTYGDAKYITVQQTASNWNNAWSFQLGIKAKTAFTESDAGKKFKITIIYAFDSDDGSYTLNPNGTKNEKCSTTPVKVSKTVEVATNADQGGAYLAEAVFGLGHVGTTNKLNVQLVSIEEVTE